MSQESEEEEENPSLKKYENRRTKRKCNEASVFMSH